MGRRSRLKRMGGLDAASAAGAPGPPNRPPRGHQGGGGGRASAAGAPGPLQAMTLRELAASIAAGLIRDMKRNLQDEGRKPAYGSAIAKFVYEGKRRTMYMPPDMLYASEDLQAGCIYGALAKVTRFHFSVCNNCGKTEQDLFTFDGITLTKAHRRVEDGADDCD